MKLEKEHLEVHHYRLSTEQKEEKKSSLIQIQKRVDGKWQKLEVTEEEFNEMMNGPEVYDANNPKIGWYDVDSPAVDKVEVTTSNDSDNGNVVDSGSTAAEDVNPSVSIEQTIVPAPVLVAGDVSSSDSDLA